MAHWLRLVKNREIKGGVKKQSDNVKCNLLMGVTGHSQHQGMENPNPCSRDNPTIGIKTHLPNSTALMVKDKVLKDDGVKNDVGSMEVE